MPSASWTAGRNRRSAYTNPSFTALAVGAFILLCHLLVAHHIFVGQAWAEGKGELVTCHRRTDSGRDNRPKCTPPQSREAKCEYD